jgi:hypothetical protein
VGGVLQRWDRRNQEWADRQLEETRQVMRGRGPTTPPSRWSVWPWLLFTANSALRLADASMTGAWQRLNLVMLIGSGSAALLIVVRHSRSRLARRGN